LHRIYSHCPGRKLTQCTTHDLSLLLVLLPCCTCLSLLFTSAAECRAGIVDAPDVAASIGQLRSAANVDQKPTSNNSFE
jgi:hypothetical protein